MDKKYKYKELKILKIFKFLKKNFTVEPVVAHQPTNDQKGQQSTEDSLRDNVLFFSISFSRNTVHTELFFV